MGEWSEDCFAGVACILDHYTLRSWSFAFLRLSERFSALFKNEPANLVSQNPKNYCLGPSQNRRSMFLQFFISQLFIHLARKFSARRTVARKTGEKVGD